MIGGDGACRCVGTVQKGSNQPDSVGDAHLCVARGHLLTTTPRPLDGRVLCFRFRVADTVPDTVGRGAEMLWINRRLHGRSSRVESFPGGGTSCLMVPLWLR